MNIREATLTDVPELVAMGQRFRATTGYSTILAENVAQLEATAIDCVTLADRVVFVAEGAGGDLLGMIGLIRYADPMSGALTVGEVFWWSEQAGAGLRVLDRGIRWAREQGASKMNMIQPEWNERVGAVYARQGFKRIEVAWQLDLEAA